MAGPRSPAVAVWSQLNAVRGDLVGDGAGVAGHGGRVRVDLVEEQFQGAGDAGRGGLLKGDGDRGGGEGDGACQAADDGLAGDGAVFVVVTQVGVEWPDSQCSALSARSRKTICRPRRPARSTAVLASGSMRWRAVWRGPACGP